MSGMPKMNDLWVHYTTDLDSNLDRRIRDIVETSGGKWFGQGLNFVDDSEGRDISFKFDSAKDFESAVGGLAKEFEMKWMRTTGDEGHYSCHYRVK